MYIAHVLIFPILIGLLLGAHLLLVAMRHHTQFRARSAQTERTIVGVPAFPGQAPRSLGLLFGTAGFLFLLGGLVQINPIWLWGPYHTYVSTNGAQPDWYLGWLIGALRLVPGFDFTIGDYTVVPNPFWGGAAFPLARLRVPLLLAVARAALHRRPGVPQPPRPAARRPCAHGHRRRDGELGLPRVPGRIRRPRRRHLRHRLRVADLGLPRARLGGAGGPRLRVVVDLQGAAGERASWCATGTAPRRRPGWRGCAARHARRQRFHLDRTRRSDADPSAGDPRLPCHRRCPR